MESSIVKGEIFEPLPPTGATTAAGREEVIELSSSDSDSEVEDGGKEGFPDSLKRSRVLNGGIEEGSRSKRKKDDALPLGFLDPLLPDEEEPLVPAEAPPPVTVPTVIQGSKQFWKAGDYDGCPVVDLTPLSAVGMDHVRVHPRFLHSNATSHKWALGALAELLDNSLDEVCHGATFVNIDMLQNRKNGTRMLLVEDNGGGMDPDKMRQCMSLGYSAKSKIASTIGQYGNGFKTSTMRLGADVIVFSRSRGKDGRSPTQSIGMLSYTFLRNTGKEDIVVPMLDYEKRGEVWHRLARSSLVDWNTNVETIIQWSPYSSEADLLQQFNFMSEQGTRIVIYNLWEDDQGLLELEFDADKHFNFMSEQGTRIVIYNLWEDDQGLLELEFDADKHDIQVRGVNRDEKKIQMAKQFHNSRHFLTYRHSLRSYASILYLKLPGVFRMILRAKEIEHHNIVNDMMLKEKVTYRPQPGGADGVPKDPNMVAVVTIGFVKDAKDHIDVQGFNVYHKNRLIKPFWRIWNPAGSDGRGVIGVLEANFVEPAHDKQDFERTTVLSRLESKLIQMQKTYWTKNCHKIGYAPRCNRKLIQREDKERSPEAPSPPSSRHAGKDAFRSAKSGDYRSGNLPTSRENQKIDREKFDKVTLSQRSRLHGALVNDESDSDTEYRPTKGSVNESGGSKVSSKKSFQKESARPSLSSSPYSVNKGAEGNHTPNGGVETDRIATRSQSKATLFSCNANEPSHEDSDLRIRQLRVENEELKDRIKKMEESVSQELQREREKNKSLSEQLEAAEKKLENASKEQEALIDIFSEERCRREREEENLRKKLKDASVTIQELLDKLSCSRSAHKSAR